MKNRYAKVEGQSHLWRDSRTRAVININEIEAENARAAKKARKMKLQEHDNLQNEVTELKSEMAEIKITMLQVLQELRKLNT